MNRILIALGIVLALAGITWRYPLFHVLPLKEVEAKRKADVFDADKFAAEFWEKRLTPALDSAADAAAVLKGLSTDADAARKEFGRSVGMSRSTFFFVRGSGAIVVVERSRVGVALDGGENTQLWLVTGPVHGNAVRDSTGLIQTDDFPDSQDFNALAAGLNRIVKNEVLPPLRDDAKVGDKLQFVACAEVPGGTVRQPLKFIPVQAIRTR